MYQISSDSDEDCYDNLPQKLQKLKNKHALSNPLPSKDVKDFESITNAVLDVSELSDNEIHSVEIIGFGAIDQTPTSLSLVEVDPEPVGVTTRSRRAKRKNSDVELCVLTPSKKGGKRGRGRVRAAQAAAQATPELRGTGRRGRGSRNATYDSPNRQPTRRARGRGRRSTRRDPLQDQYITYSVGNTDEYPDISENQLLFSSKPVKNPTKAQLDETTTVIDLEESLDNEELSVKVYWQHSEVFKFNIRRLQKLSQIFDFFVNKEGVSRNRLLFTYNHNETNKILTPDDTPESIDYNIAKFIEGGIVNKEFRLASDRGHSPQKLKNCFVVKFQCQNRKKPYELGVKRDEKLHVAMVKCAEHLEIPIAKLVFEFDGETVLGKSTPNDLDMESGDCIDVKISNANN